MFYIKLQKIHVCYKFSFLSETLAKSDVVALVSDAVVVATATLILSNAQSQS